MSADPFTLLLTVAVGGLCLGGVVVGFVFLVKASVDGQKRRMHRLSVWAIERGLHYQRSDRSLRALSRRSPFLESRRPDCLDVFRGVHRGRHMVAFTWQYRYQSGDDTREWRAQVTAVDLPAARPFLEVRPGRAGDLKFEAQAFNDRFRVESPSPRFASDVIDPRMIEWLLTDPRAHRSRWRIEGRWLLTWREGPLDLEAILPTADFLIDLRARIPEHVWSGE
ncbi:hypothetical protein [Glycomyces terrestris]|uniref:DUF3137 domain-containing protein n=1 Tax=Glycomyces terrestris TaxID=2493553 RepID=A0A426V057_9ACTN|nr:hypothetical protein [Glycomyces terrestris]RRS00236.1 hypothetical protein EIW28_06505 [Glycomyces terrestris]